MGDTKGSVDCAHQSRRPLLSSQERPSLQAHPSAAATRPYGTAALHEAPPRPIPIPRPDEPANLRRVPPWRKILLPARGGAGGGFGENGGRRAGEKKTRGAP